MKVILPLVLLGCRCGLTEEEAVDHYTTMGDLRAAVYRDDMTAVHALASHVESGTDFSAFGPEAEEFDARLGSAAGFLLVSEDRDEAAAGLAEAVVVCGDCHAALGARIHRSVPSQPTDGDPRVLHAWAQEALWWTLVNRDSDGGQRVVDVLSSTDLVLGAAMVLPGGKPGEKGNPADAAARIRRAASTSLAGASAIDHQRDLFAVLAASCADCHTGGPAVGESSTIPVETPGSP